MTTTTDPSSLGHWAFPANKQRLPDGRWVITPGEPQLRVRTAEAVRITGIPSKTLHRLACIYRPLQPTSYPSSLHFLSVTQILFQIFTSSH